MGLRDEVLLAILLMGLVTYLCRIGGFFLMRYLPITPRVEAALRAMPVALIGAILGPVAVKGGPPEWAGLAAALLLMRVTGNEFVALVGSIGSVALIRLAL